MALIIMMLTLALVGNALAIFAAGVLGSFVWTAFFILATAGCFYGLYLCRNCGNA